MALEVVDAMSRMGKGVIFKIDFEKAYDCVDWDFSWFILSTIGF